MSGISANANHSIAYSMWFTGIGRRRLGERGRVAVRARARSPAPRSTPAAACRAACAPIAVEVDARHARGGRRGDGSRCRCAVSGFDVCTSPCTTAVPRGRRIGGDAARRRRAAPSPRSTSTAVPSARRSGVSTSTPTLSFCTWLRSTVSCAPSKVPRGLDPGAVGGAGRRARSRRARAWRRPPSPARRSGACGCCGRAARRRATRRAWPSAARAGARDPPALEELHARGRYPRPAPVRPSAPRVGPSPAGLSCRRRGRGRRHRGPVRGCGRDRGPGPVGSGVPAQSSSTSSSRSSSRPR